MGEFITFSIIFSLLTNKTLYFTFKVFATFYFSIFFCDLCYIYKISLLFWKKFFVYIFRIPQLYLCDQSTYDQVVYDLSLRVFHSSWASFSSTLTSNWLSWFLNYTYHKIYK